MYREVDGKKNLPPTLNSPASQFTSPGATDVINYYLLVSLVIPEILYAYTNICICKQFIYIICNKNTICNKYIYINPLKNHREGRGGYGKLPINKYKVSIMQE